jgi:hypothetical protein
LGEIGEIKMPRWTLKKIQDDPRVASIHKEDDGFNPTGGYSYWCYLKEGFISPDMECGSIHECTLAEVGALLENVITVEEWESE